jgi:hypothetical protein
MDTRKTRALPARLAGVQRRFEHWRRTRKIPSRIPEPLWAAAVKVAGTYGIPHTAKTLRVNYNALKKRAEQEAAGASGGPEGGAVATFLELAPPARVGSCQCTLELEDASGAKMKVHLQGAESPDLAALSRSFWNPGP